MKWSNNAASYTAYQRSTSAIILQGETRLPAEKPPIQPDDYSASHANARY